MMNAKSRMRDFYAEGIIEMNTTFAAEGSYRGFKERGLTRLQGFEECFLFSDSWDFSSVHEKKICVFVQNNMNSRETQSNFLR